MSEKLTSHGGEHLQPHEHQEIHKPHHERELTHVEKAHGGQEHLETHRAKVEQHAVSGKEIGHAEHERPRHHPVLVNKQLKDVAFTRAMTRARKKLSAPSRLFSKVIHNSAVDRSSEFVGKTVARPSSMLGGAFLALVGTSVLLWATKHYGYEYNYLAVILLFVIGMALGLLIEFGLRLLRKRAG